MFEIDNYRCSFSKSDYSIYLQFYDKTTFDIYGRTIDILVLNEEIKFIPTLDDLILVFNKLFITKEAIKIVKQKELLNVSFHIEHLLFNINFSLILNKESRDKYTDIMALKETVFQLEKKIKKLKNNGRPYQINIGVCVRLPSYNEDAHNHMYKINESFKYFYISSMGDDYIIPDYITYKYLKNCRKITPKIDNYIQISFPIKHNIKHLVLYNCGIGNTEYNHFELLKIKVLEITNEQSIEHLLILNNLKKTKVKKIILRNSIIPDNIFTKATIIPKLKELELYKCSIPYYDRIKIWADDNKVKLTVIIKII